MCPDCQETPLVEHQSYIELGIPIPEWFADNGFNDLDSEWDFPPKGHTEQE